MGNARADAPPGYYDSVDTSSPAALRSTLHDVIDGHAFIPYTSSGTDTWNVLNLAQQDPSDATNIIDVYRNRSYDKMSGGTGAYDREHVWPKNHGVGYNDGERQHTDCHHLFLSDSGYNSSRSDIPFGNCVSACSSLPTDLLDGQGGPSDPNRLSTAGLGRFQAWSARRGDVARALLYMDVRYAGGADGVDLVLTDDENLIQQSMNQTADGQPTPPIGYSGLLSTVLEWHAQDPVDQRDRDRNDVVYGFQQNRNPFVDRPEWVASIFGDATCTVASDCNDGLYCNGAEQCSDGSCVAGSEPCPGGACSEASQSCDSGCSAGGGCALAGPWINELHYDNAGTDVGELFEIAGPAGLNLAGWSVVPYNGASSVRAPYAPFAVSLSGVIPDQGGCAGTLAFPLTGMQNAGSSGPDGLALVNPSGVVLEFLSYDGSFTALTGPAAGMTSLDIGVEETSTTPVGHSLQLSGTGFGAAELTWQPPSEGSPGQPNTLQSFDACKPPEAVPMLARGGRRPAALIACGLLLLGTAFGVSRRARLTS